MANVSFVEKFRKDQVSRADVDKDRQAKVKLSNVISSDITEDATFWILTTVFKSFE
jgi:hypothetical protein